jgi:hypothetical protein
MPRKKNRRKEIQKKKREALKAASKPKPRRIGVISGRAGGSSALALLALTLGGRR